MKLSWIRISRWGVVVIAPVLAAPACDDANLTVANSPIFSAPVGRLETRLVSVVNTGGVDAKLGEVSAAALGLAAPFSLVGGTCTSGAVVPKSYGSCTLQIGFMGSQAREYTQSLALSYGWGGGAGSGTLSVSVSGYGRAPIATSWDYRAFANRPLGSATETEVVVRNAGGYTVTLGDVSSSRLALEAPFFGAGGTCASGATLAPDGTCTIVARFAPTAIDTFEDGLEFEYNWAGSGVASFPHYQYISGSTVVPVTVSAEPTILAPVPVGGSAVQTLTVRNAGGEIAVLGTIDTAALGLAPPFVLAGGSCSTGLALAPNGGSCTLDVAFSAATPGAANANLVIRYGWAGSAIAFSVSHAIPATAMAPSSADCYATGCAAGQVCAQITSSAAGAGTCVSVPAPPPGCMAPCIWEARKNCLPVLGACNAQTVQNPSEPSGQITTLCDPATRWATVEDRRFGGVSFGAAYRHDAATCYSTGFNVLGNNRYEIPHTDGTGPIGVTLLTVPGIETRSVWCGPYTSTAGLDPAQSYQENTTAPECVAWERQYLDWTRCRSQASGSCAGL